MIYGILIAIIELGIFFITAKNIRKKYNQLQHINVYAYYWLMLTILTMVWEVSFILNYKKTNHISKQLLLTKTHVWTNTYDLSYLLPWNLAKIFYAEYGSYADREYMIVTDDWSRIIESSHAIFCGVFSLLTILFTINKQKQFYLISLGVGMGSQLMNSILYMANYAIQIRNPDNINYNTVEFPCGPLLLKRSFMWVNIFWTIMPSYVIYNSFQIQPKLD